MVVMYKYGTSLTPRAYGKNELVLLVSPHSLFAPYGGKPPHELGQPLRGAQGGTRSGGAESKDVR